MSTNKSMSDSLAWFAIVWLIVMVSVLSIFQLAKIFFWEFSTPNTPQNIQSQRYSNCLTNTFKDAASECAYILKSKP